MTPVKNDIISEMTTQKGHTLLNMSNEKPIMLVFLRHFGCQFCRQAMDELSKKRKELSEGGTELVFVHMAEKYYTYKGQRKVENWIICHHTDCIKAMNYNAQIVIGNIRKFDKCQA